MKSWLLVVSVFAAIVWALLGFAFTHSSVLNPGATASPAFIDFVYAPFDSIRTSLSDYEWPTNASRIITSSFAEYRRTHFHGGIDIGTNNRTGYPVYAARDGHVSRISISALGYGKMLYVTHADGYMTTYAHLMGFNPQINLIATNEQVRLERYPIIINLPPNELPVRKGDLIAFTGETGVGGPHLHFEIRDENFNPVNPLLFEKMSVHDNLPPTIRAISFSPIGAGSMIEGVDEPTILRPTRMRDEKARVQRRIILQGKMGIGIDVRDVANGSKHRVGVYKFELFLDNQRIYLAQLDRVPAFESKQIMMYYDLPMLQSGKGQFQKLYIEQGTTLPFYRRLPYGSGLIDADKIAEGEHSYRIVCTDFAGNASVIEGNLISERRRDIKIESLDESKATVSVTPEIPSEQLLLYGKSTEHLSWERISIPNTIDNRGRFVFSFNRKGLDAIKIVVRGNNGNNLGQAIRFLNKPRTQQANLRILHSVRRDHVRLDVLADGQFTELPTLALEDERGSVPIELHAISEHQYSGTFLPPPSSTGIRLLRCRAEVDGQQIDNTTSVTVYSIFPDSSGWFSVDRGSLQVIYDSGAVFSPIVVTVEKHGRPEAVVYDISPRDVLLNKGVTIHVKRMDENPRYSAIFHRENNGWEMRATIFDSSTGFFSATFSRLLGEVAIMEDAAPPTIRGVRIRTTGGRPYISFRIADDRSGVDAEELKMYIDGKFVVPEIEGIPWRAKYAAPTRLDPRRHTLEIVARDKMKNTTRIHRQFTIAR